MKDEVSRTADFTNSHFQKWSAKEIAWEYLLIEEEKHRLANNLQLMVINLQRMATTALSDDAKQLLLCASDQLIALGKLEGILCRPEHGMAVKVEQYLDTLCLLVETLIMSSRGYNLDFSVSQEASLLSAEPEQTHVLGLIAYELLTNAAKHAFRGGHDGSITVHLAGSNNQIICTVSDNGFGRITPIRDTGSKGMLFIQQLAEEAHGTCSWVFNNKGTKVRVCIPAVRPRTTHNDNATGSHVESRPGYCPSNRAITSHSLTSSTRGPSGLHGERKELAGAPALSWENSLLSRFCAINFLSRASKVISWGWPRLRNHNYNSRIERSLAQAPKR